MIIKPFDINEEKLDQLKKQVKAIEQKNRKLNARISYLERPSFFQRLKMKFKKVRESHVVR